MTFGLVAVLKVFRLGRHRTGDEITLDEVERITI
jgi:hypothetical protein